MALKTPKISTAKKITVHAVGDALPRAHYQRCPQCDTLFTLPKMKSHQSAFCPRCNAKIRDGRDWSLTRLAAMAVTMMLLMPFAWSEPLLSLHLLGVRIDANLLQGIWQMTRQGDPLTASMVLFCTVGAPVVLVAAIAYLWFGNILGMNLRPVLLMLERLKEWVMLDIYLVGIVVASIKVQDYAWLQPGSGLFAFIALVILSILTMIHLNVEQLWERFYPQRCSTFRWIIVRMWSSSGSGFIPSAPPPATTPICESVWAVTIPDYPTRAAVALAAIFRCACAVTIACKNAGRR